MKRNQLASSAPSQLSLSIARDNEVFINTVAQPQCATQQKSCYLFLIFLLTANRGKYLYQTDQCAPKTGARGRYDKYRTVSSPHQVRSPQNY